MYATDILNVGAEGLGGLTAAIGAGALIGAMGVANLREGKRGNILYLISIFIPVVLVGFAWSGIFILSMPILFLLGLGTVVIRTITATYLLTIVPEYVRGRVISLATLIYFGVPYVAGLPIGYLAEHIPAPVVVSLTAGLFFVITIAVSLMIPKVRRLA